MKSRVFTIISMLAVVVAMVAAGNASAQDQVRRRTSTTRTARFSTSSRAAATTRCPAADVEDDVETGQAPSVCSAADGRDASGNAVSYGSNADCATAAKVCSAADGKDANGNSVAYGSSADCATTAQAVSSGQLPFTGFEAGLVALAGLGLLGAGFGMRRVARRDA